MLFTMYMTFRVDGDNGPLPKRDNDPTSGPRARPRAESSRLAGAGAQVELQPASHMSACPVPSDP